MPYTDPIRTAERINDLTKKQGPGFEKVTTVLLGVAVASALISALRPLVKDLIRGMTIDDRTRPRDFGRG